MRGPIVAAEFICFTRNSATSRRQIASRFCCHRNLCHCKQVLADAQSQHDIKSNASLLMRIAKCLYCGMSKLVSEFPETQGYCNLAHHLPELVTHIRFREIFRDFRLRRHSSDKGVEGHLYCYRAGNYIVVQCFDYQKQMIECVAKGGRRQVGLQNFIIQLPYSVAE